MQSHMRVRQRPFAARGFEEVIRFILAETMAAKILGELFHLCVGGVQMKHDRLSGIENFYEHAKLSSVSRK